MKQETKIKKAETLEEKVRFTIALTCFLATLPMTFIGNVWYGADIDRLRSYAKVRELTAKEQETYQQDKLYAELWGGGALSLALIGGYNLLKLQKIEKSRDNN